MRLFYFELEICLLICNIEYGERRVREWNLFKIIEWAWINVVPFDARKYIYIDY